MLSSLITTVVLSMFLTGCSSFDERQDNAQQVFDDIKGNIIESTSTVTNEVEEAKDVISEASEAVSSMGEALISIQKTITKIQEILLQMISSETDTTDTEETTE